MIDGASVFGLVARKTYSVQNGVAFAVDVERAPVPRTRVAEKTHVRSVKRRARHIERAAVSRSRAVLSKIASVKGRGSVLNVYSASVVCAIAGKNSARRVERTGVDVNSAAFARCPARRIAGNV